MTCRYQCGSVVDERIIGGRVGVGAYWSPRYPRAALLLRQPHMSYCRKLRVAHDDVRAATLQYERARDRARRFGDRAEHSDIVCRGPDQLCEFRLGQRDLRHPRVPIHAAAVPRIQIAFGGGARGVGLRRLRAVVHRNARREQRDAPAPCVDVVRRMSERHEAWSAARLRSRIQRLKLHAFSGSCRYIPSCSGPTAATFATMTLRSLRSSAAMNASPKSTAVSTAATCSMPAPRAIAAMSVIPEVVCESKPPVESRLPLSNTI